MSPPNESFTSLYSLLYCLNYNIDNKNVRIDKLYFIRKVHSNDSNDSQFHERETRANAITRALREHCNILGNILILARRHSTRYSKEIQYGQN